MKKQLFGFLVLLAFALSISAQTVKPDPVEQNLRRHVSYLSSDKLEGRRTGEKGAISAAGYVTNRFAAAKLKGGVIKNGKRLFLQPFPYKSRDEKGVVMADAREVEAYNVIGILEGTDPVLKNEAIIIGGHYDHLGHGGMGSLAANSKQVHHGADDNASGISALIELASQFSKAKNNKRTLIFIAFGGEEEGLLGSKFYVNNPVFPLDKTVTMLNMDMVGRLKDNKLTVGGIGTASEMKGLVERTNGVISENQAGINTIQSALYRKNICCVSAKFSDDKFTISGVVPDSQYPEAVKTALENSNGKQIINHITISGSKKEPSFSSPPKLPFTLQLNEDGFGPSDHSSFYGKQIPVLFFFTGTHLDYHKPTDTFDKINYEGLRRIFSYVSQIVSVIDTNPKRPTYTVARSSGMNTGRSNFSVTLGTIPGYADAADGMVIDGVRDDSPAAKVGLKAGDKIIKLAGKEIRNVQDYTVVLGELKPDAAYEIIFLRGTQRVVAKIIPVARK